MAALRAGKFAEAETNFKEVLREQPKHLAALNLLGVVLMEAKKYTEAEKYVLQAIKLNSNSDTTFYNYGIILKNLERPSEALDAIDRAITLNSSVAESWNNRGAILNDLKRYDEAIVSFEKAISLKPNYVEALSNQGKSLYLLARYHDSERIYAKAISLAPHLVQTWMGYAAVLADLKRLEESLAAYDRAIELNSNLAEAWASKASLLAVLDRNEEAFSAYDRALNLNPDMEFVLGDRIFAKLLICDWANYDAESDRVLRMLRDGFCASLPVPLMALPTSPSEQLQGVKKYVSKKVFAPSRLLWKGEKYSHDRIRLAYVSADLREHPVGYLTAGIFEHHDKSRFETFAFFLRHDKNSPAQRRIESAFNFILNADGRPDLEIAEAIRKAEIDIAIDLTGFTLDGRPNVFAARPAPIQINFLGYSATTGAKFFDYIIGDEILIPEEYSKFYSEKIVRLPHTYLPTDNTRLIATRPMPRSEFGLPEDGFVFCCFNNRFKINPRIFDVWMRLLSNVPRSVLWLAKGKDPVAERNLRLEAERRGVDPQRLVFAKYLLRAEDHIARYQLADLFLDTVPYNAHTTASDALWAGLPLITCMGSAFAGRVAASVLNAVGLPELVTQSLEEYEALALKLATTPAMLDLVRGKLLQNRNSYPLFDTARFTRNLESAYTTIWQRTQAGEPPQSFRVKSE
jgi:protein O-GlcNAc transferase